MYVMKL